ncbi:hypothetical protein NDU88_006454 [Pleurodeles waltl]|uniref:Uncharacterized protein n=1 Tax=Pleurodeles waltl TaxID=8319 RepID=A0AAV7MCA5_PLEWA|nr:hypothetical protein NDU88_006454 [Pleurodeles waltl]
MAHLFGNENSSFPKNVENSCLIRKVSASGANDFCRFSPKWESFCATAAQHFFQSQIALPPQDSTAPIHVRPASGGMEYTAFPAHEWVRAAHTRYTRGRDVERRLYGDEEGVDMCGQVVAGLWYGGYNRLFQT